VHKGDPGGASADTDEYFLKLRKGNEPEISGLLNLAIPADLVATMNLAGAVPGVWDLVVEHPSGVRSPQAWTFEITGDWPALTVTGASPTSVDIPETAHLTIAGTGFQPDATVKLLKHPSAGCPPESSGATEYSEQEIIEPRNVVVVYSKQITCDVPLEGVWVNEYDVVVENPTAGTSATLCKGFRVTSPFPAPRIDAIVPESGDKGAVVEVELSGWGFLADAVVSLTRDGEVIHGTDLEIHADSITCKFDLTGAKPGPWDVTVQNFDGQRAALPEGFAVAGASGPLPPPPAPTLAKIDPPGGARGGPVTVRALEGQYFHELAKVRLEKTGEEAIEATGVQVNDWSTIIECTFDLTTAAMGEWDVVVENPDGKRARLQQAFSVLPAGGAAPEIADWRICGTHGHGVGELTRKVTDGYVEPRACGIADLQVIFSKALDPQTVGPGVLSIVGEGEGDCSTYVLNAALDDTGLVMNLELRTGLPDQDTYTLTIADTVKDLVGNPLVGDRDLVLSALKGDVNGNGEVAEADITAVRARFGRAVNAGTASYDVNMSGMLNTLDLLKVRDCLGHALPVEAAGQ